MLVVRRTCALPASRDSYFCKTKPNPSMVVAGGHKYKGGRPEEFRSCPLSLRRAAKGLNWIHGPLGQNRVAQHCELKKSSGKKATRILRSNVRKLPGHPIDNPDTPGTRPNTPHIYSDIRSSSWILFWVKYFSG